MLTNQSLDAELTRYVTGTVRVSDGVNSDTATINITVSDLNDNVPQVGGISNDKWAQVTHLSNLEVLRLKRRSHATLKKTTTAREKASVFEASAVLNLNVNRKHSECSPCLFSSLSMTTALNVLMTL